MWVLPRQATDGSESSCSHALRKRGNAMLRGFVRDNRGDGRNHGMVPIIRYDSSLYYAFAIIRSKQIQNRPKFPIKMDLF